MKKILFLDFDGVLHPVSAYQTSPFCNAPALEECLRPYACEIVISSSWRFSYSYAELLSQLPANLAQRVTGRTGPAHIGRHARYQEIRAYLLRRVNNLNACSWRALDDTAWEFPHGLPELIACDPNTGLQTKQLQAIKVWLGEA